MGRYTGPTTYILVRNGRHGGSVVMRKKNAMVATLQARYMSSRTPIRSQWRMNGGLCWFCLCCFLLAYCFISRSTREYAVSASGEVVVHFSSRDKIPNLQTRRRLLSVSFCVVEYAFPFPRAAKWSFIFSGDKQTHLLGDTSFF